MSDDGMGYFVEDDGSGRRGNVGLQSQKSVWSSVVDMGE